jgi:hypothetical protein
MKIYLLKTSPYNEQYIDYGYATDDDGLVAIAKKFVADYYFDTYIEPYKFEVDWAKKELSFKDGNGELVQTFYIVSMEPVQ